MRVRRPVVGPVIFLIAGVIAVAVAVYRLVTTDDLVGPVLALVFCGWFPVAAVIGLHARDELTLDADGIRFGAGGRVPWADVEQVVTVPDPDPDTEDTRRSPRCLVVRLRRYDAYLASLEGTSRLDVLARRQRDGTRPAAARAAATLADRRRTDGAEFLWKADRLDRRLDTIVDAARRLGAP